MPIDALRRLARRQVETSNASLLAPPSRPRGRNSMAGPIAAPRPANAARARVALDPLQTRGGTGTAFAPVKASMFAGEIREALAAGADVPHRVQDGPTCGLYALGMVMDFWDTIDERNLNPLVQSNDGRRADAFTRKPDTDQRLFDVAKARGYTTKGEMFYASQLGELAEAFGYRADVHSNITLDDIKECLSRRHPALVPFDVDLWAGNPGLYGGKRAHWAVIEGAFTKDGVDYLVATHGWSQGKQLIYRADQFMASVNQLNESDFPGAPKNITQTLRGKLVEVYPPE